MIINDVRLAWVHLEEPRAAVEGAELCALALAHEHARGGDARPAQSTTTGEREWEGSRYESCDVPRSAE